MKTLDEIADTMARIGNPALIRGFLESILTESEVEEISGRWELVKRLHQGRSQRSIARELGMSLCKITRGSKVLKAGGSISKKILEENAANR